MFPNKRAAELAVQTVKQYRKDKIKDKGDILMFLKRKMNDSTTSYSDKILQIKEKIEEAEAVVIGLVRDFPHQPVLCIMEKDLKNIFRISEKKYGFSDMYSGGFYPYKTIGKTLGILVQIYLY